MKKLYEGPTLKVHGDIRSITQGETIGLELDGEWLWIIPLAHAPSN